MWPGLTYFAAFPSSSCSAGVQYSHSQWFSRAHPVQLRGIPSQNLCPHSKVHPCAAFPWRPPAPWPWKPNTLKCILQVHRGAQEFFLNCFCRKADGRTDSRLIEETVGRVSGHHLSKHWYEDKNQHGEKLQERCEGVLWEDKIDTDYREHNAACRLHWCTVLLPAETLWCLWSKPRSSKAIKAPQLQGE